MNKSIDLKYNNIPLYGSKVVFFLVAKAANTSIKIALAEYLGLSTNNIHRQHERISACDAVNLKDFLKIAVVRNPWDRVVSVYYQKIIGNGASSLHKLGFHPSMTFKEFVKKVCGAPGVTEAHIRPQTMQMFCGDRFVPDFIIRMENLKRGWRYVQKIIPGIPDLEVCNRCEHPPYRECYTEETRRLVEDFYANDIEILGYEF